MSRIWGDKDFTSLSAREQQVFMMLFSFPTRNLAGVVPLTLRRWATCTSDATVENITAALRVLEHVRFVIIDWDTEEVLIRTYIRNDEIWRQPNLMVRCLKFCHAVASETLRAAIAEELTRVAQEFMPTVKNPEAVAQVKIREETINTSKALIKTIGNGSQQPLPYAYDDPYTEPLHETFAEPPGDTPSPAPAPTPAPGTVTGTVSVASEKTKRGTRLPDGWEPPDDVIRAMHEQFPDLNLRHEHDKFCDHWRAKAGKDGVKLDWVATWRNWIRTAAERHGAVGTPRPSTTDRVVTDIDALRDNPRLPQNRNRFDVLFPTDRKELSSGS